MSPIVFTLARLGHALFSVSYARGFVRIPITCMLSVVTKFHTSAGLWDFLSYFPNSEPLCRQEHACGELCGCPGNCEVETVPEAIDGSMFVGKYDTFQYTKARRSSFVFA